MSVKIKVRTLVERGGGLRAQNALYAVCGTSPYGKPIEHFLVDPPTEWRGGRLRAPMLVADKRGVNHILLGVGARYYPFVPDYVEETRRLGASKRIPEDFDLTKLTPGRSKMVLIHPRALPQFEHDVETVCPKKIEHHAPCINMLWGLSALKSYKRVHEIEETMKNEMTIRTPSAIYVVPRPRKPEKLGDYPYKAGIFIYLPITRFEYVNKRRNAPRELVKRVEKAGFELEICED